MSGTVSDTIRPNGTVMREIDHRRYQCTICGAIILVDTDEKPFDFTIAGPDRPNERVVLLDGKEVHRCVVTVVERGMA